MITASTSSVFLTWYSCQAKNNLHFINQIFEGKGFADHLDQSRIPSFKHAVHFFSSRV